MSVSVTTTSSSILAAETPSDHQGGRIVRRDIESQSSVESEREVVNSTGSYSSFVRVLMRRAIAKRLTESKSTVPHFYLTAVCRVDELHGLRKSWNEWATSKVSVNDLVLKCYLDARRTSSLC